jgi:hypothetical protein
LRRHIGKVEWMVKTDMSRVRQENVLISVEHAYRYSFPPSQAVVIEL